MPVTPRSVSATTVRAPSMKSSLFDRAGIGYSKAARANRSLTHGLVMGTSVHARHPVHLHTALSGAHRLEPEIDCHSRRRAAAVHRIQACGDEVHRPAHAYAGGEPRHSADRAEVPRSEEQRLNSSHIEPSRM